jgi:hypothetical protein
MTTFDIVDRLCEFEDSKTRFLLEIFNNETELVFSYTTRVSPIFHSQQEYTIMNERLDNTAAKDILKYSSEIDLQQLVNGKLVLTIINIASLNTSVEIIKTVNTRFRSLGIHETIELTYKFCVTC